SLHPDLVVLEEANGDVAASLESLGLAVLRVDHRDVEGILESVTRLGLACDVSERAADLRSELEARLADLARRAPPADRRPRVLVTVGRDVGAAGLRDVYAASRGTFLGELLAAAGGENALDQDMVRYPTLGREALLRLRPDHVLALAPELADDPDGQARLRAAWEELGVPASHVHLFTDDAPTIPGPGCVATAERFAAAIAAGEDS
ncbi:ABC transporter substrate-binding protein, partial [bacterium]|nr:ABC transporter substrate-binding protein [bacterium]